MPHSVDLASESTEHFEGAKLAGFSSLPKVVSDRLIWQDLPSKTSISELAKSSY